MLHPHSLEILDQNLVKFKITSYQNTLCWLILLSHHQFNKVFIHLLLPRWEG